MFRERVTEHYRSRGYKVHERVKVRGKSGSVHAVDLVAQGNLGNLVVSFGDEGGLEGAELSAVRRAARDIGAAAVAAVEHPTRDLRRIADAQGVRVLDEASLEAPPAVGRHETAPEAMSHPWPTQDPGMRRSASTSSSAGEQSAPPAAATAAATLWRHPRRTRADSPASPRGGTESTAAVTLVEETPGADDGPFSWLRPGPPKPRDQTITVQEVQRNGFRSGEQARSDRTATATPQTTAGPPQATAAGAAHAGVSASRAPLAPLATPPTGKHGVSLSKARPEASKPTPQRAARPDRATKAWWEYAIGPALYGVVTALVLFLFAAVFL